MKSVKKDCPPTPPTLKFPCLMEGEDGRIVLFTEQNCGYGEGAVVYALCDPPSQELGYTSTRWDMSMFKPFNGTITLGDCNESGE